MSSRVTRLNLAGTIDFMEISSFSDRVTNIKLKMYLASSLEKYYKNNLIAAFFDGSYGAGDEVYGYSDVDILTFVTKPDLGYPSLSFQNLDIQLVDRQLGYNFSPINSIKFKYRTKLITGQDVRKTIPSLTNLFKHNFLPELQKEYFHATIPNSPGNIWKREPRKWGNYIINMADLLALAKSNVVHKYEIPQVIANEYPKFRAIDSIIFALKLREPQYNQITDIQLIEQLHQKLDNFLLEFKKIAF